MNKLSRITQQLGQLERLNAIPLTGKQHSPIGDNLGQSIRLNYMNSLTAIMLLFMNMCFASDFDAKDATNTAYNKALESKNEREEKILLQLQRAIYQSNLRYMKELEDIKLFALNKKDVKSAQAIDEKLEQAKVSLKKNKPVNVHSAEDDLEERQINKSLLGVWYGKFDSNPVIYTLTLNMDGSLTFSRKGKEWKGAWVLMNNKVEAFTSADQLELDVEYDGVSDRVYLYH